MEPLVSLTIRNKKPYFEPGDELDCEYQIDAIGPNSIMAIETSILWYTEGKGDEDLGVHYFERRTPNDEPHKDLRELHRFQTTCPASPLSYNGELLTICWCIRVRVFPKQGEEVLFELPFVLGQQSTPKAPLADDSTVPNEADVST